MRRGGVLERRRARGLTADSATVPLARYAASVLVARAHRARRRRACSSSRSRVWPVGLLTPWRGSGFASPANVSYSIVRPSASPAAASVAGAAGAAGALDLLERGTGSR